MLWALHDKGGGGVVELINMGLKPAVFGFLKQERKSVVEFVGPKPNEAVRSGNDIGFKDGFVVGANARVNPITGNHQVCVRVLQIRIGIDLEYQFDIQGFAAALQDVE